MEARLHDLLNADLWRMAILHLLRTLDLPDGWVATGFVRDAVWDHLHGHALDLDFEGELSRRCLVLNLFLLLQRVVLPAR